MTPLPVPVPDDRLWRKMFYHHKDVQAFAGGLGDDGSFGLADDFDDVLGVAKQHGVGV